jgi:hypothetical protein
MATTQLSWQWDDTRRKYYYHDTAARAWIYQDNTRIPYDQDSEPSSLTYPGSQPNSQYTQTQTSTAVASQYSAYPVHRQIPVNDPYDNDAGADHIISPKGKFMHTNDLVKAMEMVHDHVLYWRYDIFESRLERLHYIDPRKEHISLLVCQHLLGTKPGDCSESWSHTHPDLEGYVPSMGIYLEDGKDEQTLVIDLGYNSMTTVSPEHFNFP